MIDCKIYKIKWGWLISLLSKNSLWLLMAYLCLLVLYLFDRPLRASGDTVALISGIKVAVQCLQLGKVHCDPSVVHFPIFQYLIGFPFVFFGMSDENTLTIFSLVSLSAFFISVWAFFSAGDGVDNLPAGGHLGVMLLLSGYVVWYSTSTFNESAAFALFSLLGLGVLKEWNKLKVAIIAFLCVLTKEIAFPFVIYLMLASYILKQEMCSNPRSYFKLGISFFRKYTLAIITILIGICINLLFNLFRFNNFRNISNLDPAFLTPFEFIPRFFYSLLMSPAGGVVYVWFSLSTALIILILYKLIKNERTIGLIFGVLGVLVFNAGLAMWYSPFGWVAWGPRLTLPILGAVGIMVTYSLVRTISGVKNLENNKLKSTCVMLLIFVISAAPTLSVILDEGIYFKAIFAPTRVELDSGIKPFIVQTVPADAYMRSAIESHSRNVIPLSTLDVVKENPFVFIALIACFGVVLRFVFLSLISELKEDA